MKSIARLLAATLLLVGGALSTQAANTKTTVSQVTNAVTLTDDTDYIVTSATPFATGASVNIANTEHAVLILENVKPSAALQLIAQHVLIDGAAAQNGANCQVKLYAQGTIVMPYASTIRPLTVYSEQNFQGDECSDFGLEHSGGYMNTLTAKKLNNRIRSFRLKRGYMVTFALRPGGRGYSRCFIAADRDLEVATLPAILDNKISSYRVFKWNDTSKKGLASNTSMADNQLLNTTACYDWAVGYDMLPDFECVPHHIYEDWPSSAACGSATWAPHMQTNNEPGNSADDHPQTVKQILDNWENLMATGMRLCSPSSHDGSLNHLREFMDSIDARGWRCDIIDLHCYWPESSFSEWSFKSQWVDRYHRPIWISEWVWGASWNSNGAFANGVTEAQNAEAVERICTKLNNWDYIERYYYWNSERDPSRLVKDGKLTQAGQYYTNMKTGVGYNGRYDFIPKTPRQGNPQNLEVSYDKQSRKAHLTWYEPNGEMNQTHRVERRLSELSRWETLADITMQDAPANYTFDDPNAAHGYQYRIHVVDLNGTTRDSRAVTALSETLEPGDPIALGEKTLYVGGNLLVNGDFDLSAYGWTDGEGNPIDRQHYFQVVPVGGTDGGTYLQAYGHGTNVAKPEQSLLTRFTVDPQADYYFSVDACNCSSGSRIAVADEQGELVTKLLFSNPTADWATQKGTFNTDASTTLCVWLRNLGAKAQFDKMLLCRLFEQQADALADGLSCARARAKAFCDYNTLYPTLNSELTALAEQAATATDVNQLVDNAIRAYNAQRPLSGVISRAEALLDYHLYGEEALQSAIQQAKTATTADAILTAADRLSEAIDTYLPTTTLSNIVQSPSFTGTTGWTVKCGTFTGGDQRTNAKDGVTFWNAWWSGISADEGQSQTMEIKQEVSTNELSQGYNHGLYSLSCVASTEHFCLSDQHAYIANATTTATSQPLTADYYDLPTVSNEQRWQTLTTLPVYIADQEKATIGFVGSKQGATDFAWHELGNTSSTGDQREGWWCATRFVLSFTPLYKTTAVPGQWGVVCLPYALHPSKDITYYRIAGVNPDYTQLCVEPIQEAEAGVPVIYKATAADISFNEYGPMVADPGEAAGNLRGYFNSGRAASGYYILQDGQWNKITGTRPTRSKYSALIRPFGTGEQVPVIDDWTGETMPLNGVTDEEKTAAINPTLLSKQCNALYTVDGRRVDADAQLKPGVYVNTANGRTYKFVVR